MPRPIKKNARYMPGIDGLRAIAVLAVIAYHLNLSFAPGGLLGVGVFFVLSGYLITDLLIAEWEQNGRIRLKAFWIRRVRRLVPALLLILVTVSAWVLIITPSEFPTLKGDVLAALFYVSNWWFVFHHVSYFASFGPPSPLGHLWSLAVEEQFYILWPLILLAAAMILRRRGWVLILTLLLALASALAMGFIYQPGSDPSRVYYGTDTRAFSLLIGAALALIWPSRKLATKVSATTHMMLNLVGCIGLSTIVLMIWLTSEYDTFLYRGGFVVLSIATAAVVAVLAHPASHLGKMLGIKPLRWIGVRSYGIYLWHYPVIILTSPVVNTNGFDAYRATLQVMVSILLAALSWKFVEDPIRRGIAPWSFAKGWKKKKLFVSISAVFTLGVVYADMALPTHEVLASFAPYIISMDPFSNAGANANTSRASGVQKASGSNQIKSQSISNKSDSATKGIPAKPKQQGLANSSQAGSEAETGAGAVAGAGAQAEAKSHSTKRQSVTAIGDSVMLDIAPDLKALLPGIVVDGHVGRQMIQAQDVVLALQAEGKLGNTVVIELGTNGPFTKNQLTSLLDFLGYNKHIILVNTRVPRPWQNTVNQILSQVANAYPNVKLMNWYNASAGHNAYFYPDGVHLNPTGAKVYADLVANAIQS